MTRFGTGTEPDDPAYEVDDDDLEERDAREEFGG